MPDQSVRRGPNVILINCDDLGYGDLACYGSPVNATPALDRMASEGVRFTDFCMASSICSPSRAAMLTGCYPKRINVNRVLFPSDPDGLGPGEVTLAQLLKQAGYATMIVGKWHCGDQPEFLPTRFGFDGYFGLPYSNDMGIQAPRPDGWNAPPLPLLEGEAVIQLQPDQSGLTERYVERAVRFIRENNDRPFFLYMAHMHVHLPHYVASRFLKQTRNGPYGAAVECVDWSVAALLWELRRLGLEEKTLVIFTSDNGSRGDRGGSNRPLRGTKFETWEGGFRVPCIMYWKGAIKAGQVCTELVTSMDFYPTLAALAGVSVPGDRVIDGKDIFPLMSGRPGARSPHDAFFYYHHGHLEAVRSGRWKLHARKRGQPFVGLYDLEADVAESTDLAQQYPEVVGRLTEMLSSARADMGDLSAGVEGRNCRPGGYVDHPVPLATFEPDHPYMWAEYDLPDRG